MSIDRFILEKLSNADQHTRTNLLRLFIIRIRRAEKVEAGRSRQPVSH
ncbi:hypothetical protein SK066_13405 [Paenibacillus hunanensis]|jgi:hypothetical protein|nr:hypothetical protein [Paenibacillus hunanensis]WPP39623.1 hypothetical protein SK066_13405 [Paenibacillus hunanensis]